MSEISPTRFTPEELKLISRALNRYSTHHVTIGNEERNKAGELAARIYRENFRIGMECDPPKYQQ